MPPDESESADGSRRSGRIGGAGGFWGDRVYAPIELLKHELLDYIMLDYLAELTLSIMAKQKARDASAGWATDLTDWLRAGGMTELHAQGVKLITDAGGANPEACARAVREVARDSGWNECKVAIVVGDDIMPRLPVLFELDHPLEHMETGESLAESGEQVIAANAYLGAGPIAAALQDGADIVITGRVADASLLVGCMVHAAGWSENAFELGLTRQDPLTDWAPADVDDPLEVLAQWTVAGHLIECGAQVTGGNSTDWETIPELTDLALPVAEVDAAGTVVITRAKRGGGRVDRRTVAEQLVYEIGDPAAYITPDVIIDMRQITLEETGPERVTVAGARGEPQPDDLKVSAAVEGGWFASSSLLVSGPNAIERAENCDALLRGRLAENEDLVIQSEFIGAGITLPPGVPRRKEMIGDPPEVLLRWAVRSDDRGQVVRFGREVAPLVLTGPAGVAGYGARPKPRRQLRYWPALIPREMVEPLVRIEVLTVSDLPRSVDRLTLVRQRTQRFIERLQEELEEREWARPLARRLNPEAKEMLEQGHGQEEAHG